MDLLALVLVIAAAFIHATWNLLAKRAGGGRLFIWSGLTNAGDTNAGAEVAVTGDVVIAAGSCLYLRSHPTNAGAPWVTASNVTVLDLHMPFMNGFDVLARG